MTRTTIHGNGTRHFHVSPLTSPLSQFRWRRRLIAGLAIGTFAVQANAGEVKEVGPEPTAIGAGPFYFDTAEQHDIRVDIVTRGLRHGYSLAFLPNDDALIVERGVRLRLIHGVTSPKPMLVNLPVSGVPDFSSQEHIHEDDVLGIQDVALHPDFEKNHLVYYTYNKPIGYDAGATRLSVATVLASARFEHGKLIGAKDLLTGETVHGPGGSRILFGKDNMVYVSVGALSIGDIESAQRTDNIYGKVLRITADGKIPADNPFVGKKGARSEIYSYGHRDPLGIAIDSQSGAIIVSEHGPQGGDELNQIASGGNYGWPKYTYGTEYSGSAQSVTPVGPGTKAPSMIWIPAIAPSGIAFYTENRFPDWKNNLFIASARRGEINGTGGIVRVVLNDRLQELRQETLLGSFHQRFKDIRQGPDGLLYALTDEADSMLVRISPAPRQPR